jgi:2-(1,2-epoxy-1,2-dihydrophenyl)acetyl-CoA isomerase
MTEGSDTQGIVATHANGVAEIALNKPDQLNALDFELAEGLVTALHAAAADDAVRTVLITGRGRSFMAGGDLKVFHRDLDGAAETAERLIGLFHEAVGLIRSMDKIVIAAVHGPVAGGGLGLAMACDLCLASDDATFLSAYTKLGTSPDGGTTWSLTQLLGPRAALGMMVLNDRVDAAQALALGLVNRVLPRQSFASEAARIAAEVAAGPAEAFAGVKKLVQAAASGGFADQLQAEKRGFVAAAGTPDFREGINAFFERRPPRFG